MHLLHIISLFISNPRFLNRWYEGLACYSFIFLYCHISNEIRNRELTVSRDAVDMIGTFQFTLPNLSRFSGPLDRLYLLLKLGVQRANTRIFHILRLGSFSWKYHPSMSLPLPKKESFRSKGAFSPLKRILLY